MSGHTPGPWLAKFGLLGGGDRSVYGRAFDGSFKYICDRVRGGSPEQAEANARLIAAAPDLLEAAKLTALHFKRMNEHTDVNFMGDDEHECWAALNAAIAKAEGR